MGALRITGLPYKAAERELSVLLKEFNYVKGSAKIQIGRDGRPTGQAAVLMQSQKNAMRAFDLRQRHKCGNRRVLLHEMTREEYEIFELIDRATQNMDCNQLVNEMNTDRCIKLSGLPYFSNCRTILRFFEGFNL